MVNSKKTEPTEKIKQMLLTPITCIKTCKGVDLSEGVIHTGQQYRGMADADMSDFAIGFYEIIYKDLLPEGRVLKEDGSLMDAQFAGDTMNSFNTVANKTPGAGISRAQRRPRNEWPAYLREYYDRYHCLANFWILPMQIGRTTNGCLNKAKRPVSDYMDRFLTMLKADGCLEMAGRQKAESYGEQKSERYFSHFNGWADFSKRHFLTGSYVDKNLDVKAYTDDTGEMIIKKALANMEARAQCIAESKYAGALSDYFDKLQSGEL